MNWRDNPQAVARLKKGVDQWEVATLTMGSDFSWSGPFDDRREAERECYELNESSYMRSQVLLIRESTK